MATSTTKKQDHRATAPLAELLSGDQMVRVGRRYETLYAPDPALPRDEYNARMRGIAARMYPGIVKAPQVSA